MKYVFITMWTTDASDSNGIGFQLKLYEMMISMSYIIVNTFNFIFTLNNLMAIISYINM